MAGLILAQQLPPEIILSLSPTQPMLYSHHCLISSTVSKCCADQDRLMKRIITTACCQEAMSPCHEEGKWMNEGADYTLNNIVV